MNFEALTSFQQAMLAFGVSTVMGYLALLIMLRLLPRKLRAENTQQRKDVIQKANQQKAKILQDSKNRVEKKFVLERDALESEIEAQVASLQEIDLEMNTLSETINQSEARIEKQTKDHNNKLSKLGNIKKKFQTLEQEHADLHPQIRQRLEVAASIASDSKLSQIKEDLIQNRQLEAQKSLKDLQDELNTHSGRLAHRMLSRMCSRYSPTFAWPKSSNVVEITNKKTLEAIQSGSTTLLSDLAELTEDVQVELSTSKDETPLGVKLSGGYGIYKEAAKLTLTEILNKGPGAWSKVSQVYSKNRTNIERQALNLGRRAINELQLHGVHDEIQKMVGALNWRTSYRQNQYLHSVEVAKLAGILAQELGLDPDEAKRCGLLHDIGKGIDYKIGGSHAVISGDYADRFGEARIICDTVMSHHNDLNLETPMSYVLKTADTLSGARPGARVNLEEGYQIRLSAIEKAVRHFAGASKVAIMSGGREVHVEVNHSKVKEGELEDLVKNIAKKIEEEVAYPGQIKVLVTRRFESTDVA